MLFGIRPKSMEKYNRQKGQKAKKTSRLKKENNQPGGLCPIINM
jgi:hypothetical protein